MAEESDRPGTCRSKVGVEAIDEPCTKRMVPLVAPGRLAGFSQRNRRTSPLPVQCSRPATSGCPGRAACAIGITSRFGQIRTACPAPPDPAPYRSVHSPFGDWRPVSTMPAGAQDTTGLRRPGGSHRLAQHRFPWASGTRLFQLPSPMRSLDPIGLLQLADVDDDLLQRALADL